MSITNNILIRCCEAPDLVTNNWKFIESSNTILLELKFSDYIKGIFPLNMCEFLDKKSNKYHPVKEFIPYLYTHWKLINP